MILQYINIFTINCFQTFYDIVSKDFYNAGQSCGSMIRKSWAIINEYGQSGKISIWFNFVSNNNMQLRKKDFEMHRNKNKTVQLSKEMRLFKYQQQILLWYEFPC